MFAALKVVALPMSIKEFLSWVMLQQALSCVLTHMGYMEPHKLSSFDSRQVGRYITSFYG
jgi:hypothetical protein